MTDRDAGMELLSGFAHGVLDEMRRSKFVLLILYEGNDATVGIQLGIAVMLDKPILVIRGKGIAVSHKLRQVADEIVEIDIKDRSQWEAAQPQVEAALTRMMARMDKAAKWDAATKKQNWRQQ